MWGVAKAALSHFFSDGFPYRWLPLQMASKHSFTSGHDGVGLRLDAQGPYIALQYIGQGHRNSGFAGSSKLNGYNEQSLLLYIIWKMKISPNGCWWMSGRASSSGRLSLWWLFRITDFFRWTWVDLDDPNAINWLIKWLVSLFLGTTLAQLDQFQVTRSPAVNLKRWTKHGRLLQDEPTVSDDLESRWLLSMKPILKLLPHPYSCTFKVN